MRFHVVRAARDGSHVPDQLSTVDMLHPEHEDMAMMANLYVR
jgi:hypothetical protein